MTTDRKLRILVVPLDWGLGHATRCLPVVKYLLSAGHEVVMAGEGKVAAVLEANLPEIRVLPLSGYRVSYGRLRSSFTLHILGQLPKILRAIRRERRWLRELLRTEHFDLVISDNRYGLYSRKVCSVILTHQLQVISGMGKAADGILRRLHYRLLGKFTACWVVDNPGGNGLGGVLSHPGAIPRNARYIGWLSQFLPQAEETAETPGRILVLISGPEPTRGLFETALIKQASALPQYRFIVAAGAPGNALPEELPSHIIYHSYLGTSALQNTILSSDLVICRSGYSTLMDLAVLGKKALLVPTPGQTEQEYLGKWLQENGTCCTVRQERLDLEKDIPIALSFPGFSGIKTPDGDFHEAIDTILPFPTGM